MKKIVMSIAAVAAMLLVASCGNKTANADSETKEASDGTTEATTSAKAQEKTTYEQFTVEKYGVTVDVPTGMRRTDDPVIDNGACWTLVPEDDDDFPIYAAMAIGVYESFYGEYTDERIKEEFENDIPEEAEKQLDLEKKEYTYSVGDNIKEFHRVVFKGNRQLNVTISYTDRWEKQLGGDVRDHIMNSAKFN